MPTIEMPKQLPLPQEDLDEMNGRVASGEFATQTDFVHEAIRHFVANRKPKLRQEADANFSAWLRAEALPILDAMDEDPTLGLSLDQVSENLAQLHRSFQKAG